MITLATDQTLTDTFAQVGDDILQTIKFTHLTLGVDLTINDSQGVQFRLRLINDKDTSDRFVFPG